MFGLSTAELIILLPKIISAVELFIDIVRAIHKDAPHGTPLENSADEALLKFTPAEQREFDKAQGES